MKVRIGMIGVGNQGKSHIDKIGMLDNAEVVRVYDFNQDLAKKVAEEIGASVASTSDELLDPRLIDAVIICSPQFTRDGIEETAARRGIHLMAEKPLGLDMKSVQAKVKIIKESGIIHAAGYCLRYLDTVIKAKEYLATRSANLIQVTRIGTCTGWPKWMRQQHLSGGNMIAGVTHQVDMVRFLGGEVRELSALQCDMDGFGKDPEDTILSSGVVSFAMEKGGIGTITESVMSPHHSGSDVNFIGHDFFVGLSSNGYVLTIKDKERNESVKSTMNAVYEQNKAFVNAIANGSQQIVLSSYEDALQTLAISLAAEQSAQQRKVISLQQFIQ